MTVDSICRHCGGLIRRYNNGPWTHFIDENTIATSCTHPRKKFGKLWRAQPVDVLANFGRNAEPIPDGVLCVEEEVIDGSAQVR